MDRELDVLQFLVLSLVAYAVHLFLAIVGYRRILQGWRGIQDGEVVWEGRTVSGSEAIRKGKQLLFAGCITWLADLILTILTVKWGTP